VLEPLNQLSALSQAVKEQRWQRGSFELKLLQRQYPYYDEGGGQRRLFTSASTDNGVGDTSESSDSSPLASARYSGNLPVQPAPEAEDVQEMIKLVSNLGVELARPRKCRRAL